MSLPEDDRVRELVKARYVPPNPDLRARVRASLESGSHRKRSVEWLAAVAVIFLALAAIGTFTAIRLSRQTAPAQPVVTALTGVILAMDLRADGSGWVVTEDNAPKPITVYWTADAGRSWHLALELPSGAVSYLRSFGPDKAVLTYFPGIGQGAAADNGVLYITTDSGRSWASNPLPAVALSTTRWLGGIPPSSGPINFLSPEEGMFCGHLASSPELQIFRTQDGGRTWARVPLPASVSLVAVVFKDSVNAIAPMPILGSAANPRPAPRILVTNDGGKAWTPATLPLPPIDSGYPGFGAGLESVTWSSGGSVEIVLSIALGSQGVGGPEKLYVYRSGDNGATWLPPVLAWSGKASEGVPLPAILATDRWAVAAGRNVTVASEKGLTIKQVDLPLSAPYQAELIDFPDATHGFIAAGPIGTRCTGSCAPVILATADGGLTWKPMSLPPASGARTARMS